MNMPDSDAKRPPSVDKPIRSVFGILAVAATIFALGWSLLDRYPAWGFIFTALGVLYLIYEVFSSVAIKQVFPGMLGVVFGVFIICLIAGLTLPKLHKVLGPMPVPVVPNPPMPIHGSDSWSSRTIESGTTQPSQITLRFKAASVLTPARQREVTKNVNEFVQYLREVGFRPPTEFPLLGIDQSGGSGFLGQWPGTVYDQTLFLDARFLDNKEEVRWVYAKYIFEILFHRFDVPAAEGYFRWNSARILARYYVSSFANKPFLPRFSKWDAALWETRQHLGKEFVDRALFYTFNTWAARGADEDDFDKFFLNRFLHGVYIEDNGYEHVKTVVEILRTSGLPAEFPKEYPPIEFPHTLK